MCIFTQPVEHISDTSIFARRSNGNQFIVYRMTYAALGDLAMVLPIPCPSNPSDDAVRFINLQDYVQFFDDMQSPFIRLSRGIGSIGGLCAAANMLEVHDVGDFEASFVPDLTAFNRLDERFRIPDSAWDQLPRYVDYAFVVFKLKAGSHPQRVHPMAFEFPSRYADLLYFPTLHIHDGEVHETAEFHHTLYCQAPPQMKTYMQDWAASRKEASQFMRIDSCQGMVAPNERVWQRSLQGQFTNRDTEVGTNGGVPIAV